VGTALRRKNGRGINRKGGKNTKRKVHWYFVGSLELYDRNTCIGLVLGLPSLSSKDLFFLPGRRKREHNSDWMLKSK
jgi:hypothetical protein